MAFTENMTGVIDAKIKDTGKWQDGVAIFKDRRIACAVIERLLHVTQNSLLGANGKIQIEQTDVDGEQQFQVTTTPHMLEAARNTLETMHYTSEQKNYMPGNPR